MKKWTIPEKIVDLRFPDEILQEYADALFEQSAQKLTGQVTETISYDSDGAPRLSYALNIYVTALKQSYRLFEIEQIAEDPYPVNLKVILLSGSQMFPSLLSPQSLDDKLSECTNSTYVSNLIGHFIRLSGLKEI